MSAEDERRGGGYGKPPAASRFRKGQSGNPRGRPKGRRIEPPYEKILGRAVTIREDGVTRKVTGVEAFLLTVLKRGLEGDSAAARTALAIIEGARARRSARGDGKPRTIVRVVDDPGSVSGALETLRMAMKLDRYREAARMVLEPWLVEAALARLGNRRLSVEEQRRVIAATRTPTKVRWPPWWSVRA